MLVTAEQASSLDGLDRDKVNSGRLDRQKNNSVLVSDRASREEKRSQQHSAILKGGYRFQLRLGLIKTPSGTRTMAVQRIISTC
ncbi:unnamed protein product [Protopolystoma xenopodis]|uniref:Uncharacterized protein n=1 Tax=Protopolystoma xenopodis TaxID=117903 RepID=A0A3S5B578_9PLAT|nr:unnamed protein product [Protopolystoma xenopodis]